MSIFGDILGKIFHAASPQAHPTLASGPSGSQQPSSAQPAPSGQKPGAPGQPVDVEKVLTELAAKKGGGGNWRTSIVDLLSCSTSIQA